MTFKKIIEGEQSIMDLAIQEYGELEGMFILMEDNPDVITSLNSQLQPGDELVVQLEPVEIEDKQFLNFFRDNDHRVVNGEVAPIGDFNNDFNNDFMN